MQFLIGLGLAVALLYFWLIGHWFARVLMFLLLGAGFFAGGAVLGNDNTGDPSLGIVLGLIGVVVAWFTAGIPIYWRRWERYDQRRKLEHVMEVLWRNMPPPPQASPITPPVPALPAPPASLLRFAPRTKPAPERKPWNWGAIFSVTWMALVVAGVLVLFQHLLATR